ERTLRKRAPMARDMPVHRLPDAYDTAIFPAFRGEARAPGQTAPPTFGRSPPDSGTRPPGIDHRGWRHHEPVRAVVGRLTSGASGSRRNEGAKIVYRDTFFAFVSMDTTTRSIDTGTHRRRAPGGAKCATETAVRALTRCPRMPIFVV